MAERLMRVKFRGGGHPRATALAQKYGISRTNPEFDVPASQVKDVIREFGRTGYELLYSTTSPTKFRSQIRRTEFTELKQLKRITPSRPVPTRTAEQISQDLETRKGAIRTQESKVARTRTIESMDAKFIKRFLDKATKEEKEEFLKGSNIKGISIGDKGSLVYKYETPTSKFVKIDKTLRFKEEQRVKDVSAELERRKALAGFSKADLFRRKIFEETIPKATESIIGAFEPSGRIPKTPIQAKVYDISREYIFEPLTSFGGLVAKTAVQPKRAAKELAKPYKELLKTPEGKKQIYKEGIILSATLASLYGVAWLAGKRAGVGKKPKPKEAPKPYEIIKPDKRITKTPLRFDKQVELKLSDKKIEAILKRESKRRGIDYSKLSKIDREFLKGQFKSKLLTQSKLGDIRDVTLKRFEPQFKQERLIERAKQLRKKSTEQIRAEQQRKANILWRTQPELFISKTSRKALRRYGKQFERERLIQEAIKLRRKSAKELTLEEAKKLKRLYELEPSLFLPKVAQKALKKVKVVKPKVPEGYLTAKKGKGFEVFVSKSKLKSETSWIEAQRKATLRTQPERLISKKQKQKLGLQLIQKTKPLKKAKIKDVLVYKTKGLEVYIPKTTAKWIKGQVKAKVRNQPEKFIPKPRQQALLLVQKPKLKKKLKVKEKPKPIIRTKQFQYLAYKQVGAKPPLRNILIPAPKKPSKAKKKRGVYLLPTNILQELPKEAQAYDPRFYQLQEFKAIPSSLTKTDTSTLFIQPTKLISPTFLGEKTLVSQKELVKGLTLQKGLVKVGEKLKLPSKLVSQKISLKQKRLTKQKELLKIGEKLKTFEILKPKPKIIPKPRLIPRPSSKTLLTSAITKVKKVKGFQLFVKRFGEFKPIGTPLAKAKAIKLGERITKTTLAATFMIKETKKSVLGGQTRYEPSGISYRTYKVVKGRKIPLENIWIEKRAFRLGTIGEKTEIQRAKRKKQRSIRWL